MKTIPNGKQHTLDPNVNTNTLGLQIYLIYINYQKGINIYFHGLFWYIMARAKSKLVIVLLESIVTGHKVILCKPRLVDKLEVLRYDPMLQGPCLYREIEKVASYKRPG